MNPTSHGGSKAPAVEGKHVLSIGLSQGAQPAQEMVCAGTLVGGFYPDLSWLYSCCLEPDSMSCTGCGYWANGECQMCAPGFMKQHGVCVLCDDMPGWEDEEGATCTDYELRGNCSAGEVLSGEDKAYKGLRASQACCSCGGGEMAATPWRYPLNNDVLLYGQELSGKQGRPEPRTARRHEVQPDCGLASLGLSLGDDGSVSGKLPKYESGDTGISESCTVTAVQDELQGVEMSTELRVSVQPMSYGSKVIVIRFPSPSEVPSGQLQWNLQMSKDVKIKAPVTYESHCMPSAPWIRVEPTTGALNYVVGAHKHGSGLSGEHSGFESTQCLLTAKGADGGEVQSGFAVMKVFLWSGAYYPQTIFARKGRPIAGMQLWREPPVGFEAHVQQDTGRVFWVKKGSAKELEVPPAKRPEVQGVKCEGAPPESPVKWSKSTGLVTVGGQAAFVIDPTTGDVSGTSEVNLPVRAGRSSLALSCAVALGGELYDYTMTVRVGVQVEDDTCWFESEATDSVWAMEADDTKKPCNLLCQARGDCGMYWMGENNTCTLQTSTDLGMAMNPSKVMVRSLCEEGVSCIKLKDSRASFIEGEYCPRVRQMVSRCFRPTYHDDEVFNCDSAGYIMYSMRLKKERFGAAPGSSGNGHFACVYFSQMKWYTGGQEFIPEPTDILVASVDPTARTVVSLEGTGDVFEGVRKGYASGSVKFQQGGTSITVSGQGFMAWECGDVSTAVFSRAGMSPWDELYMARGPCPIHGRGGNWVIHRANETDYMNPKDGSVELRGEVLACLDVDVERESFRNGTSRSTMWMPEKVFSQDYYDPIGLANSESKLEITASLVTDTCGQPEMEDVSFLIGTTSDPDFYSLDVCECFGEAYRNENVVAEESRKAVTRDPNRPFNHLSPEPQLLVEGPYTCEDASILPNGQKNEVSEEQCSAECYGDGACEFFDYVPQLRFCTLHQRCERLGHTGLETTHKVFGIFREGESWCRIADPEACWAQKHRRALLAGTLSNSDQPCAFQHVLAQCDLMQMATAEAHGTCRRCEYYPLSSEVAGGIVKKPLPQTFPGGTQLEVTCNDNARLMSFVTREQLSASVITCVSGKWMDMHGEEGTGKLTCVDCVQVSQPDYNKYLDESAPEVYFMSMRIMQYHHGVASGGCNQANELTQAPLRTMMGGLCLQFAGTYKVPQAKASCDTKFFLTMDGFLRIGGPLFRCLDRKGKMHWRCDKWHLDKWHRLRGEDGQCLKHSGKMHAEPTVSKCSWGTFPLPEEQWYFDGGDCRYTMQLRGAARPLTWRFQLHGGAILGSQQKASTSSSNVKDLIDPMAYGTCRTNLRAYLNNEDKNMRHVNSDLHPAVPDIKGVRGMMFTLEGRMLFTCSPGGEGGAEMIAQYQEQAATKAGEVDEAESGCGSVSVGPLRCQELKDSYVWKQAVREGKNWTFRGRDREIVKSIHSSSAHIGSAFRRRTRGTDRRWKVCFQKVLSSDITFLGGSQNTKEQKWSDGGRRRASQPEMYAWREQRSMECAPGWVMHSVSTKAVTQGTGRRRRKAGDHRRRAAYERQLSPICQKIKGYNEKVNWTARKHTDLRGTLAGAEIDVNPPDDQFLWGWDVEQVTGDFVDRSYKFMTMPLCTTKHDEIAQKTEEFKVLTQKIQDSVQTSVSCAKDMELPVNSLMDIGVVYVADNITATMTLDVRCPLLHRGDDEHAGSQEDYTLTASQFTEIARTITYHAVGAANSSLPPFESKVEEKLGGGQRVGWFTLIDDGATVWGLLCEKGSVVVTHSEAFSPHCFSVGAAPTTADIILSSVVPGSGYCDLGYAMGGWYNLPGTPVARMDFSSGGPMAPSGYKIYCREVPGLSRLCEDKESRCEKDEVVTGLSHELGQTIKYRCCKLPKIMGYTAADSFLHGIQSWEGYFCPTRLDETGRPEYTLCNKLGLENVEQKVGQVQPRSSQMQNGLGPKDFAQHSIFCRGGEVLNEWRVEKTGHMTMDKMRASFTCMKLPSRGASVVPVGFKPEGCTQHKSKEFSTASLRDFFSNVEVLCDSGKALSGFRLEALGGNKGRYSFLCCAVFTTGGVNTRETSRAWHKWTTLADFGLFPVACKAGEAMTGFRQKVNTNKQAYWRFDCVGLVKPSIPMVGENGAANSTYTLTWDKFGGVWKLWDGSAWEEPLSALPGATEVPQEASHSEGAAVRLEPPGYLGSEQGARFWINGKEATQGSSNVLVLEPGAKAVDKAQHFKIETGAAARKEFVEFMEGIKAGRLVLMSFSAEAMAAFTGPEYMQLQRCGCSHHLGQAPEGSYSLIGIVEGQAVAESQLPGRALEATLPLLSVAPIVEFGATFVATVSKPDPFPKYKPLKPKLLHFSPKKPDYDRFCDLKQRTFDMAGMDCESDPDACPKDEHPCAHTFQYGITEQVFWTCQQQEIDRNYVEQTSEAEQGEMEAEGSKLDMIFELVESGVSLASAAAGAIPWGSFAVPAKGGAKSAVDAIKTGVNKVVSTVMSKIAAIKQMAAFKSIAKNIKRAQKYYDAASTLTKTAVDLYDQGKEVYDQGKALGKEIKASGGAGGFAKDVAKEGVDKGKEAGMAKINEDFPAVPRLFPPDADGSGAAKNKEAIAESTWADCNPIQFGLSKMMCDLYCVENAVKEGDSAILANIKTSHTVLMTNFERLLDYHTQTLMWGMGQLRDQLLASGSAKSLLFFPGKADREAIAAGKLPDDVSNALKELDSLPKMLEMDLPENTTVPAEVAAWHGPASDLLLNSVHRLLDKSFKPGGDVKAAAQKAKGLVQRFASQTKLELKKKGGQAREVSHVAQMTQRKALALRKQIRNSQEVLEVGTPAAPVSSLSREQDASVMAWYEQVSAGFVAAHEQHATFVQSRQRALQAAEHAVAAAETYVSCGETDLKELQNLWQKAYRLEDQAVSNLLGAWAASSSAREKLSLAVQRGLVATMVEKTPLPPDATIACGTLQAVADAGYALAVKSVDKTIWPVLEEVLALERLSNMQQQELEAKALAHVERVPLNATVSALYVAARDAADPEQALGQHLAARALNLYGPSACPAPPSCQHGGMLLLNSSHEVLWTSSFPGDLLLGRAPAQVARACGMVDNSLSETRSAVEKEKSKVGMLQGQVGEMKKAMVQQEVTALGVQQQADAGSSQSVLSALMNGMGALMAEMKEMNSHLSKMDGHLDQVDTEIGKLDSKVGKLDAEVNVEKMVCGRGCEEKLQVHLSKKRSAMSRFLQRLR